MEENESQRLVRGSYHRFFSSSLTSNGRNVPTSVTMSTAWLVPLTMSFVTTAGLMAIQTIFTWEASMFPPCSIATL